LRLLPVAVAAALKGERLEAFSVWMRENLRAFMDPTIFPADIPADLVRGMACQVGLMILEGPAPAGQPLPVRFLA
jgi:hypothetical protein